MKIIFSILLCCVCSLLFGQTSGQKALHVLFVGDSYTHKTSVNYLPEVIDSCARSSGNKLIYSYRAQGGYSLQDHYNNGINTLDTIRKGGWDYVVLQEKSNLPALPDGDEVDNVFYYAHKLSYIAKRNNPCVKVMFYMTWGWENGYSDCSPQGMGCYLQMDSMLRLRYMQLANREAAEVSPVGAVWKYLRTSSDPALNTIQLYHDDKGHPTHEGTYAAACCFYSVLFRKDPSYITYNYTLSPAIASGIRAAAKKVVYDNLSSWLVGAYDWSDPACLPSCNFDTPRSTSLPGIGYTSYRYAHVLGNGGPDLSNVTSFAIQWDSYQKMIYNLSFNTSNGLPNWYVDLKGVSTNTFSKPAPTITFSGSGIAHLDGTYYVNQLHNGDFVMVSTTGRYTIYFSNSASQPVCSSAARLTAVEEAESSYLVSLSPNPASDMVTVTASGNPERVSVNIFNFLGAALEVPYKVSAAGIAIDLSSLPAGIYMAVLELNGTKVAKRLVVER